MTHERDCACKRARHSHGTSGGYFVDRCRCDQCSEAARIYRKRAKWRAHTGRSDLIDAAPTIAHVERLVAAGWTINQIGERSGVNGAHIGYIIGRSSKAARAAKVYRKTAAAILSIPVHVRPDSGYVDATGTKRRIRALVAIGWTFAKIAARRLAQDVLFAHQEGPTVNPCTFEGCNKPSRSKGLCRGHYTQHNRGQTLRPLNAITRCTFDGCGNRAKAAGLCDAHDKQRRRGTTLHPLAVRRTGCTFPGCGRKHYAKGACETHYTHLRKYGEMVQIGSVPAGRRVGPQSPKGILCTFDGCGKPHRARGYCSGHYDQVMRGTGELRPLGQYVRKERPRKEPVKRTPRPKSRVLPAGWERTEKAKPRVEHQGFHKLTEVPTVSPTDPALMRAALGLLRRHGAEDLAEMLGVSCPIDEEKVA